MRYSVFTLNKSEYFPKYMFKAIQVLAVLNTGALSLDRVIRRSILQVIIILVHINRNLGKCICITLCMCNVSKIPQSCQKVPAYQPIF